MRVYRSNSDYKMVLYLGCIVSAFCTFISITFLLQSGNPYILFLLIPAIAVLYLLLFSLPKEIRLESDRVVLVALFRTTTLELKTIKGIKEFSNSAALNRADGDPDRVDRVYFIRLRDKPWQVVFFGNQITEYRDLAARMKELV